MERFFKRVSNGSHLQESHSQEVEVESSKQSRIQINIADLPYDPGLRAPISDYSPNIQDEIRRHYLQQGSCQPKDHKFPFSDFGKERRRFNTAWYDLFPNWLEYSIDKDSMFCLCCYLFKPNIGEQAGSNSFVGKGFSNWKKKERLVEHVGNHNSYHYQCYKKCEALMTEKQQIQNIVLKKNIGDRIRYRTRLTASVDCIRFLIRQGLAFRVDESRDVSIKEQMVVMFRYVNKKGYTAIDKLFSKHGLSISRLRGQRYDGASNMSGEFNSLKTIIMRENECAFFVHCFPHQLQLALMGVAKKHGTFFTVVSNVVNIFGALSKRRDILREKQALKVIEALKSGELSSGKGLNQEIGIKRPCDTRWGTHFGTLVSFITMFSSIVDVLKEIANDRLNILQKDDQDIVSAMDLVKVCKQQLQMMRDTGWNSLVDEISDFCVEQNIDVLNMENMYCAQGKSRRKTPKLTNMHYYHVDFLNAMIDLQL
ncbi:hypothetical protein UlMin_000717 [Ulmus minor]